MSGLELSDWHTRQINTQFAPTFAIIYTAMKTYEFKKARIKNCGGDLSKRWYLEFYIWSEKKAKLVRRRWYVGFDKFNDFDSRMSYAREKRNRLNKILPHSCVDKLPKSEHVEMRHKNGSNDDSVLVYAGLVSILNDQFDKETKTYKDYRGALRTLNLYLKESKKSKIKFEHFKKGHAQLYIDYLLKSKKSGATIHNNISRIKSLTNKMIQRDIIENNPFLNLKLPRKVQSKQNVSYSLKEMQEIKAYCIEKDPFLWLCIQLIFYTYIRPAELRRLKIMHLDLDRGKVHVPGELSKNSKTQTIEIPGKLLNQLIKYTNGFSKSLFLLSSSGEPSTKQLSVNFLGNRFRILKNDLGFDSDHTLYSVKHTGVVEAYKNGVDIKAIQQQCRHHSVMQTDTYLKSLGFSENAEFLKGMPEI